MPRRRETLLRAASQRFNLIQPRLAALDASAFDIAVDGGTDRRNSYASGFALIDRNYAPHALRPINVTAPR